MFVPPLQIHIWKLSSLDNAIFKITRLWWGHAGRAPMMVLISLYEDEETRALSLSAMLGQSKKTAICHAGRELLPSMESVATLSRTA